MRFFKLILCVICLLCVNGPARSVSSRTQARPRRVVIAASTLLDGRGRVLRDTRIVVEGAKIVALDPKAVPSITTCAA